MRPFSASLFVLANFVIALVMTLAFTVVHAQLSLLPGFPLETNSTVDGSLQCTKSSDEIYAVCGSVFGTAIKYNLQPFSFAVAGAWIASNMMSCDLFEAPSQSMSRAVCTQQYPPALLFLRVSDMNQTASASIPASYYVVVDTPNEVAYVSNNGIPSSIFKIINIASSSPLLAGNVTWGQNSGDQVPYALLIVGDFLYGHLYMYGDPARLARIRISNFSHDQTVQFLTDESGGQYDNLANDNNFIYDLTINGILVRCTYKNNNFARFDSLNTDFTSTYSLSISPDLKTLFFTARDQNAIVLVEAKPFYQMPVTAPSIPFAFGRPIVMSNDTFFAFSQSSDLVYGFKYSPANATCPCGSFCPAGSTQPTPCSAGTFNPNINSVSNSSCKSCPDGVYCPEGSCSPMGCSCGMYCSEDKRLNCTPGYYNSDPSFFCSLCPEGFYCPLARTCSPIKCARNQFCPPGSSEPLTTELFQLPNSPIATNSGVRGSLQCTKSSDEIYAVCGSVFGTAIKYNLQPFSFAANGPSGANTMMSCDLYETSSRSTSRVVCTQQTPAPMLFLRVSDMTQTAQIPASSSHVVVDTYVVVDTPNEMAYVSNVNIPPIIFKIINIASASPLLAGNVTWGRNSGDQNPFGLLIVGEFLYAHLSMYGGPARLARIRISNFSHDQTVQFANGESYGQYDNLANDNNFIFDLTQQGILVRCTYKNNNFARFDSIVTVFTSTYSLSISPDEKTLFFAAEDQNGVVLVDVARFSQITATAPIVPSALGRPIVMSNGIFYAFSWNNDQVYGFRYCNSLSATYGGASKHLCPAGYFCPDPNATSPTPCSPGTYSPSTGLCFCPFCPSGAYCPSASTITPQNCPVGTYNENNGASSIAACLPCPLGKICPEGSIVPLDCNQINCDSTRNCTSYRSLLVGVTNAQPYCVVSDHSTCPSPLTCSSINLPAYDIRLQCEAAGCSYSGGSCVNRNDCFNLFLPSFVIQPLGLMFIGFAKDVIVLLLIGIFGDVLMRKVQTMMIPFHFWKNKWNRDQIKVSMETTIFANDANCRNESSTKRESFEEYCEKIADALFELPEIDDEEMAKDRKRKLVDAITFSMFDFGLRFELENVEENNNKEQEITLQKEEIQKQEESETIEQQTETSKQEPIAESRHDDEVEKGNSKEVIQNQKQSQDKNEGENQIDQPQPHKDQENVTSGNLKCNEEETNIQESQPNRKMVLSAESFVTSSVLQQFVNAHITSHAQCVVYFASSRDWKVRAASALNNFPSTIQLFYYITSVIVFVAFTFRDVVLDSTNHNIIGQVSSYTCGTAEKHSQSKTTYLLLGFRLLNSSSTATVILIFIKTLHAIYSSSSEKFKKLQLPQRLPILGLQTSKSTQILLVCYFIVVASFALAGVTYGLHIIPSLVVVSIAAVLLILDSAILKFVRAFISKRKARQDAERDKVLEQLATQELPFLGLNADERHERKVLTAGSGRSLYTEVDPLGEDKIDVITADQTFEAAKQSVLNPAPTVSLPQALLVFLLKEEIPTIILTITLQMCFNYLCLYEFGEAFGVANEWQLPNTEYETRKFDCIWGMFESDVSSKISVLTSFVGFL